MLTEARASFASGGGYKPRVPSVYKRPTAAFAMPGGGVCAAVVMADIARQFSKTAGLALRASRCALREPGAALTLLRMAAWVAAVSLLLKRMPLPRVLTLAEPRARRAHASRDAVETQARLARLLDALLATDFLCFTPTCWKRAPVLHRFLALEGIETRVVFGVRREGSGALGGHAWLEAGGEPLLETTAPDYKVTYSFPARTARMKAEGGRMKGKQ